MGAASNASEAIQGAGKKQLVLSFVHLFAVVVFIIMPAVVSRRFSLFPFFVLQTTWNWNKQEKGAASKFPS